MIDPTLRNINKLLFPSFKVGEYVYFQYKQPDCSGSKPQFR